MVIGPTAYDVPLLPFEKDLIRTVGITEAEYREFIAEAKRRGAVRPAAYDHIPDIQASGAEPYLISLAIGLVLSGASYLLAPKPKDPASASGGGTVDLGSVSGASRFSPSRGFETVTELADYAAPIPLLFGLYKDGVGGMLTTPKLVWSRMFSHGTMQRAKLLFVVGEQGIAEGNGIEPPALEGIFMGNNTLDATSEDFYAFYWRQSSVGSQLRIRGSHKRYGTQAGLASGAPDVANGDADAFLAPTATAGEFDEAFCHAYSPANNTQFGVYGAIANGTGYRVNYEVVPIPEDSKKKNRAAQMLARMKVVGDFGAKFPLHENNKTPGGAADDSVKVKNIAQLGQQGAGRNYSPRMGIVELSRNGQVITAPEGNDFKTQTEVQVGDEITFVIHHKQIPADFYRRKDGRGVPVEDINSKVEAMQLEADEAMQLGEQFEIGGSIWKVVRRRALEFDPTGTVAQRIFLRCVDTSTANDGRVGVVNREKVVVPDVEFIGDSSDDPSQDNKRNIKETYYPLCKVAIGVVRNNRPAVSTEIGLKSVVFQRLNGLCNFQGLPNPNEVRDYDEDNTQVKAGSINAHIMRTSMFRVFIREIKSSDGTGTDFQPYPVYFVVRGQTPTPQYNFLRFSNSEDVGQNGAAQLEFKFVPISGSDMKGVPADANMVELITSVRRDVEEDKKIVVGHTASVGGIGEITLLCAGRVVTNWKDSLRLNKEFVRNPRDIEPGKSILRPTNVQFIDARPDAILGTTATAIKKGKSVANAGIGPAKGPAFFYDIFGAANSFAEGSRRSTKTLEYINPANNGKAAWLHLKWTVEAKKHKSSDLFHGQEKYWNFVSCQVLGSGINFSKGEIIEIKRGSQATNVLPDDRADYTTVNPYASTNHPDGNMRYSGYTFRVASVATNQKLLSRSQAWRYHYFSNILPASASTVDQSATRTLDFTQDGKTLKVDVSVKVKKLDPPMVGQQYGYKEPKIVKVHDTGTTTDWEVGNTVTDKITVAESNPFKSGYDKVGQQWEVLAIGGDNELPSIDTSDALVFAEETQVSDISHYRDLVDKSNNNEPENEIVYVNEVQANESIPGYNNMTLAGLSLKASRNFTRLDQLRCWIKNGMDVERLHPNKQRAYGGTSDIGPSNLFTDLVYFLMTDQVAGAGGLLAMSREAGADYLIDKPDLVRTSRFLVNQKLFFNGPIVERTNLRRFVSDTAPYFLCNFVITDGKFSLKPALPVTGLGKINEGAVQIEQLFTGGNILEDTFKVEYLGAEERRVFKAVVRYRLEKLNQLPEEKVVTVQASGADDFGVDPGVIEPPQEQFDVTQFCTSEHHAVMVAKYFLALRAHVTHTISFSTTCEGLNIQAGSYIKVITESSPYSSANNGTISTTGVVTSVSPLEDGTYKISYFNSGGDDVEDGEIRVVNGKVNDSAYHDSIFTLRTASKSENVYVVEQLTFSQEGTVDIVASEHPCDDEGRSKIVQTILDDSKFVIDGIA